MDARGWPARLRINYVYKWFADPKGIISILDNVHFILLSSEVYSFCPGSGQFAALEGQGTSGADSYAIVYVCVDIMSQHV